MATLDELDDALDPNGRRDFRRVGRGIPLVQVNGKWERFSRSSNAGKVLDDENALADWRIRTMLLGAAYRPELMAQVSTLDGDLDKKQLRDIAEECLVAGKGRARQVKGTAVHAMLDHIDRHDVWEPTPDYALACQAYVQACAQYGLVCLDIEVPCINVGERLAGTMDRRYRTTRVLIAPDGTSVPIGSVLASDTKTGRTLEHNQGTYSTQLAAYVDSELYDLETNTHQPFEPGTYKEWGLVMHVVVDDARCDVYWVDLNAGREGLKLARQVKAWRKRSDLITPCLAPAWPVAVPNPSSELPPATGEVPQEPTVVAPESRLESPESDVGSEEVYRWLRERVAVVTAHPAAKSLLLREWPEGVPGLRELQHTEAQLNAIEMTLDMVEREHSLPFPQPKPGKQKIFERKPPAGVPKNNVVANATTDLGATWVSMAKCVTDGDVAKSLENFARLEGYTDLELTELLDAAMRGIGHADGIQELHQMHTDAAAWITHAAELVKQETYVLRFVDGKPLMLKRTLPINP